MKKFFNKFSSNKKLFLLSVIPVSILIVLLSFLIALPLNIALLDSPFFPYKEYYKIDNWDLSVHITDRDLDGDEKNDIIFVTGCAFLSRVSSKEEISIERQCEASIPSMIEEEDLLVGQRIGDVNKKGEFISEWNGYSLLAYLVKTPDDTWLLVQKPSYLTSAKAYTFDQNGLIQRTSLPFVHKIYVTTYVVARILLIPIFFIFFFLPYLLQKFMIIV